MDSTTAIETLREKIGEVKDQLIRNEQYDSGTWKRILEQVLTEFGGEIPSDGTEINSVFNNDAISKSTRNKPSILSSPLTQTTLNTSQSTSSQSTFQGNGNYSHLDTVDEECKKIFKLNDSRTVTID